MSCVLTGITVRFVADQVERSEMVEDVKFYAGGVLLDKEDVQSLWFFKHFMFRFNQISARAEELPCLSLEEGVQGDLGFWYWFGEGHHVLE